MTSEAQYRFWDHNLPMGRVAHLHVLDVARPAACATCSRAAAYELHARRPGRERASTSRPTAGTSCFAFDPQPQQAARQLQGAGRDRRAQRPSIERSRSTPAWDFERAALQPRRPADRLPRQPPGHAAHDARHARAARARRQAPARAGSCSAPTGTTRSTRRCAGSTTATRSSSPPRTAAAPPLALRASRAPSRGDRRARRLGARASTSPATSSSRVADAMRPPGARARAPRRRPARAAARALQRRAARAACASAAVEEVTSRGANGDPVQMWLIYPPGFEAARQGRAGEEVPAAAPHPRRPARGRAATPSTTAGTTSSSPPRATSSPASTTTARAASATPSSTASRTAGASSSCRTSRPAPTGCWTQPWVDTKRVFATGGSYGGYMVAWMNGHVKPGRYNAYVCHAGCFDWTRDVRRRRLHLARAGARRRTTGTTWRRSTSQSPHAFAGTDARRRRS